jgi:hypothetical protein
LFTSHKSISSFFNHLDLGLAKIPHNINEATLAASWNPLKSHHSSNSSHHFPHPSMDTEQTDPNLLLLALNLSDSEPEEAAAPTTNTTSTAGPSSEYQPTRAERTALSEEAFQALKQSYRPKVENGNVIIPPSFPKASGQTTN